MIVADNIRKDFREIKAVRNISFEVKRGETMVLLGTSGCGKTTTLKMLNRLIEASSGKITIDGKDIFQERPEKLRRTIGYVSQNNGLFPHFTVSENIAIIPKLLHWTKSDIQTKTEALLAQLKIPWEEYAHKYPDELSGGQKQRVAVARALIADAPVLLMDEPFGALDPVTRAGIRTEFTQLPELKRKTIVLVTHDIQEALELGDKICLMDQGEIVQSGTARDLLMKPVNDFVKAFFESQRLYLELKSLSFNDIWELLPHADDLSGPVLWSNETLWKGMEYLSEQKKTQLVVVDKINQIHKKVTLANLQESLNRFKYNL
ncbi:ABC transporter ATP-binding protein [Dyadobacter sp. CY323]|uniref:ABC transporter ATP-binding protein n=1 Tax=Dyadobacter sp. CY323 TaxID=2907302 RepID=UPI00286E3258|nr:ABC transporter ATP-binding protein [Dyadobacter sp. CY323]